MVGVAEVEAGVEPDGGRDLHPEIPRAGRGGGDAGDGEEEGAREGLRRQGGRLDISRV